MVGMNQYMQGDQLVEVSTAQDQAYTALERAAERMGANNYAEQCRQHQRAGRAASTFRFVVTEHHVEVIAAMPKVLDGTITPEDAMALLWQYDTMKQRLQ